MLLSMMVGNGAQLCAMLGITLGQKHAFGTLQIADTVELLLVFALLGFLSPSNRGSLATVMIVCWTFFGGCVECWDSRHIVVIPIVGSVDTSQAGSMCPSEASIVERMPSSLPPCSQRMSVGCYASK